MTLRSLLPANQDQPQTLDQLLDAEVSVQEACGVVKELRIAQVLFNEAQDIDDNHVPASLTFRVAP